MCRLEARAREKLDAFIFYIPELYDESNKRRVFRADFEKKNADIIEFLYKNAKVRYVFVDAAYGNCDWFNILLHEGFENHAEMAKEYLQRGEIRGAEYLQLFSSDLKFHIWGVEDRELYRKNQIEWSTLADNRVAIDKALRYYQSLISKRQSQVYGPDLRRVIALFTKFQNNEITLKEYVPAILEEASQLDLPIENWPALENYQEILQLESGIDNEAVQAEHDWLWDEIIRQIEELKQLYLDPTVFFKWTRAVTETMVTETESDDLREIIRRQDWDALKEAVVNVGENSTVQNAVRNIIIIEKFALLSRWFLFSWGNVPGNDSDRLLRYLMVNHGIGWAESAEIRKSDDGKTIRIFKDENSAEITLDEKEQKATFKISDGRTHDLIVKKEKGKLNIHSRWKRPKIAPDQQLSSKEVLQMLLGAISASADVFIDVVKDIESWQSRYASRRVSSMEVGDFFIDFASLFEIEDASIPNLLSYLAYLHRSWHSVCDYNLFDQIRSLEGEIRKTLARTDEEQKLEVLENELDKLTKFVTLRSTVENVREVTNICIDLDPTFLDEISNFAGVMRQDEIAKHREVLKDATEKAREYYEDGCKRGISMAKNLLAKVKVSSGMIDRAILMTTGYQLRKVWDYLRKHDIALVLLMPTHWDSNDHHTWPPTIPAGGFGDLNDRAEEKQSPNIKGEVYNWSIFEDLPEKKCNSHYCTTEGRLILQRIVCLEGPSENMVFWCDVCKKFRCARCAVKVPVDKERFEQLPYSEPLKIWAISENKYPFTLRCKHCGEFLGMGDHTVIFDVKDTLDTWRTFKKRRS